MAEIKDRYAVREQDKKAEKMKSTVQNIYDNLVLFTNTDDYHKRRVYFYCINQFVDDTKKMAEEITDVLRKQ